MSFGQANNGNGIGWDTTLFIVGLGVVGGFVLVSALGEANKCPRLHVAYKRSLTSTGEERKLSDFYLDDAQRSGCRWARRWPFAVER